MFIHIYKPPYKNYHVAAFPMQDLDQQDAIRKWCYQTFGAPGYRTNTADVRWVDYIRYGEVKIEQETDLMLFLLKWQS